MVQTGRRIPHAQRGAENKTKLPGVKIPDDILCTTDLEQTVEGKDILVLATASPSIRSMAKKMAPYVAAGQLIVDVSKGIEESTLMILTDVIAQEIPQCRAAVLSGPSHAEEVGRDIPTTVVAGAKDRETAEYIQNLFMNKVFRVYTSPDMLGIELGGALKSHALAAGAQMTWLWGQYQGSTDHQRNCGDEPSGCGHGWTYRDL